MTERDIDGTEAMVGLYLDCLREPRASAAALEWGGLCREATLDLLGDGAAPEAIDALLDAARVHP